MALQYWQRLGESQRQQFLSLQQGYHGDTLFTMQLCDPDTGMHRHLQTPVPQQHCIPMPVGPEALANLALWLQKNAHTIAGIIIEPLVQGAGGMQMHSPEDLHALCTLCRRYDLLIIMDEIFTGFYRTGTLLACEQASIVPDLLCLSKALTGGTLPLAVTMAASKIYEAFLSDDPSIAFMHGTTFMGNALACAAANASLDLFETIDYAAQVQSIEQHLSTALTPLASYPGVSEVRIKGAIGAVALSSVDLTAMQDLQQRCIADNIWLRPIGNVLYTTPALNIDLSLLDQITSTMIKQIISTTQRVQQTSRHVTLGVIP